MALRQDPYFVGRAQLLKEIVEAAARADALVVYDLHGPGGIGKTTLLAECAARISGSPDCPVLQMSMGDSFPAEMVVGEAEPTLGTKEERLAMYRRALEGLVTQLFPERAAEFRARARDLTDVSPSVTALELARDRLQDAFVGELQKTQPGRIAFLIDDVSRPASADFAGWLMDLVAKLAEKSPTVVIATRNGCRDERSAFPGRVVAKQLAPFSPAENGQYLELRADG